MNETGIAVAAAAITLGPMVACFAYGIPGVGAALVGLLLALFALEYTFNTQRGFLPSVVVATLCGCWIVLGMLGRYLNALHWL